MSVVKVIKRLFLFQPVVVNICVMEFNLKFYAHLLSCNFVFIVFITDPDFHDLIHSSITVKVCSKNEGIKVITDSEHRVELSEAGLYVGAEQGDEAGAGKEAELPRPRARAHQALLPPGAGV